ncbi:MAG: ArsR/SmtB family transcription factor [Oscillospiraceae bacterium]|jgi:ArsR family transcriptional regulator
MNPEFLRVFRAFSDENRLRVLELLCSGEKCACTLLADLNISQSTLSHHMSILCKSGIVKSRRVGRWNYYTIDQEGCEYGSRLLHALSAHKMDQILRILHVTRSACGLHRYLRSLVSPRRAKRGACRPVSLAPSCPCKA